MGWGAAGARQPSELSPRLQKKKKTAAGTLVTLSPSKPLGGIQPHLIYITSTDDDDDDEFRFNDASTHEGHLRQNGELTWFCNETIIMISHKCIKCKTRTNLKFQADILC